MTTTMNIHKAYDARCESFQPDNNLAFTIEANGVQITLFGMDPPIAWGMFDLLRDGKTSFHYDGEDHSMIGFNPQASAELIRRAREETLPVVSEAEAV